VVVHSGKKEEQLKTIKNEWKRRLGRRQSEKKRTILKEVIGEVARWTPRVLCGGRVEK